MQDLYQGPFFIFPLALSSCYSVLAGSVELGNPDISTLTGIDTAKYAVTLIITLVTKTNEPLSAVYVSLSVAALLSPLPSPTLHVPI